jgi:hypothetical protein
MNERIQKLAEQATEYANEQNELHGVGYVITFKEKFAELIVQECISIVDEQKECLHEEEKYWHDRDYGYALAVDDASKGIKQFFGVKE